MSRRAPLHRSRTTAVVVTAATFAAAAVGACSGQDERVDGPHRPATSAEQPTSSTTTGPSGSDPSNGSGDAAADPDGTENSESRTSAGSTIPPDFPSDVPLPPGYTLSLATVTGIGTGRTVVVQLRAAGEPASTLEQLATALEASGWTRLQFSTSEVEGSVAGSATFSHDSALLHIGTIASDEPGTVAVSYSLIPDAERAPTTP